MRNLLDRYLLPPREGDGAGSGAAAPGGATPPAASPAPSGAGTPPAAGPSGEGGAGSGTPPPPAAGVQPPAAAGQPYRPQGLPETMFGDDDRGTIDKMAEALKGYRTRDSERGIPDKVDAYMAFDLANVDATVKPHMEGLVNDPLYKAVADVALAEKVPVGAMQKIVTTLYGEAVKAGVFEGFLDVAAERAQLLPDSAKALAKADQDKAIDARMQENEDFLNLLAKPGEDGKALLEGKDAEHVKLMLMDSAAGNRFLEFFRAQMTGAGRAQPLGGGAGAGAAGGTSREALRARMAAPEMQVGHPKFSQAAYDQLMADYQKLLG